MDYRCTEHELVTIAKEAFWLDAMEYIDEQIEAERRSLENTPAIDVEAISSEQSTIKTLRNLKALPELMLQDLRQNLNKE